ncbi:hypothetical protein C806_00104 [Lachnospiraceae bacterium 3-1]|nr:hypothetical protein C806_00104 [Lachnospiraceae bacterium 3-1]
MSQRVSLTEAAKEIGCCKEFLRQQMKKGEWDLGEYVKPGKGQKKASYFIFREKLDRFLGILNNSEKNDLGKGLV